MIIGLMYDASLVGVQKCIADHYFACSLKRIKHSRAYLNFLDASEVLKFRSQFAGHAFVNKKGAQYRCNVEYAPYQRIPREKAKEDPREGTYENGQSGFSLNLVTYALHTLTGCVLMCNRCRFPCIQAASGR